MYWICRSHEIVYFYFVSKQSRPHFHKRCTLITEMLCPLRCRANVSLMAKKLGFTRKTRSKLGQYLCVQTSKDFVETCATRGKLASTSSIMIWCLTPSIKLYFDWWFKFWNDVYTVFTKSPHSPTKVGNTVKRRKSEVVCASNFTSNFGGLMVLNIFAQLV